MIDPRGAMVALLVLACLTGWGESSRTQTPVPAANIQAEGWTMPGGDAGKRYYSPFNEINRDTVDRLGLAWEFDLETERGQEATPVIAGGKLITSTNLGRVYALDPHTGRELWRFVPEVDMQVNRTTCCDQVNRGVAIRAGLVFVGALDATLYALDLETGKVVWQTRTLDGEDRGQHISGAPEVAGDVVLIGHGGAEYGVRGYVSAFDTATGALRWRFYTVPRDPALGPQESPALEMALSTWGADTRWETGLGGTVWDAIHYDPDFNTVYIGVGNGGPYHARKRDPDGGDHLFLSSLVALDPASGELKWFYQETPGDSWDYTATQPMILTDLEIDAERVPALIHAPKNGFLYVFDRRDGTLLRANPIVYQNWTDGVDPHTGRPRLRPDQADYFEQPRIVFPGTPGARNWHPASYNPDTGLYYAAVQEQGNLLFTTPGPKPYVPKTVTHDAGLAYANDLLSMLPMLPPPVREAIEQSPELERVKNGPIGSYLRAYDPLTGAYRWSVPTSSWQDRGGVLSTAGGLVFNGDVLGRLSVYDALSGELLKRIDTGTAIMAAPMSYRIGERQYIAVLAGWGGGGWPYVPRGSAPYEYSNRGRLLVFTLDGAEVPLPESLPPLRVAPAPPPQAEGVDEQTIARGRELYFGHCILCHASQQRTIAADLRRMEAATHTVFDRIVRDGLYLHLGMPRWDDVLSEEDTRDIHAYLIAEQQSVHAHEAALQAQGKPLDTMASGVLSSY